MTAARWGRLLRELGQRLTIAVDYDGRPCDLLIALHARKSWPAVRTYRRHYPAGPLVVALTGTDLYRDIQKSRHARQSLELADCLVLLQPSGLAELPAELRRKARVIYQSAEPLGRRPAPSERFFEVCVLGHLRHEKDPLRTALAVGLLPKASRVRVVHAGEALGAQWAERARSLMRSEPRYRWLGELPRGRARRLLARSRLLVLSSRMEGGANVISEAIVAGVPVLASRISGSVGLLGADYPGLFPVGDTRALARLLLRAERKPRFYDRLRRCCDRLRPLFDPARERGGWRALLDEFTESQ